MHRSSNSQADLKALLVVIVVAGTTLLGVGLGSIVNLSTRDTGLLARNLTSW
jgi:hypothetical protein